MKSNRRAWQAFKRSSCLRERGRHIFEAEPWCGAEANERKRLPEIPTVSQAFTSYHPSNGGNHMSKKAAEHHKKASEHLTHAARHHEEAAKHHGAGSHEKAAHHAHVARGHVIHARGYAEEAVKAHLEEHGKK
jgi:hypothetical protein